MSPHPLRNVAMAGLAVAGGVAALWALGLLEPFGLWVRTTSREVQDSLAGAVRAVRAGHPGAWAVLLATCFSYGFLHAAGPGHGKAVIAGYGVARRVALAPLAGLALAASLAQAAFAVVLVYCAVWVFGWSRVQIEGLAEARLQPLSYAMVGGVGLWLVWRGLSAAAQKGSAAGSAAGSGTGSAAGSGTEPDSGSALCSGSAPGCGTVDHDPATGPIGAQGRLYDQAPHRTDGHTQVAEDTQAHNQAHTHTDNHTHTHIHTHACGHAHGPSLDQVADVASVRDAVVLVAAIAIRPCSGAIFLLIVTYAMGIGWAGVAGAFAMGSGTAVVTVLSAGLAFWAREGALMALPGAGLSRVLPLIEVAAGALIASISLALLLPLI